MFCARGWRCALPLSQSRRRPTPSDRSAIGVEVLATRDECVAGGAGRKSIVETIGQAVSSGCFRMTNEDVTDLYNRVSVGATVIVKN